MDWAYGSFDVPDHDGETCDHAPVIEGTEYRNGSIELFGECGRCGVSWVKTLDPEDLSWLEDEDDFPDEPRDEPLNQTLFSDEWREY